MTDKKIILHFGLDLSLNSFGGVVNYSRLFNRDFSSEKYDIKYFSMGTSPKWSKSNYTFLDQILFWLSHLVKFFSFSKYLYSGKIALVHFHSGMSRLALLREGLFSLVAYFLGVKTVFMIHGWKDNEFNWEQKSPLGIFLPMLSVQSKILVLSNNFKAKLLISGISDKCIEVTSTMVQANKYLSENKKRDNINITFCATLFKKKGAHILIEALEQINFSKFKLHIIGHGPELESLRQQSTILKDKIVFYGFVSEQKKLALFKQSHIFAFPTYYGEGFPTVVLEAMASSNCIISTKVGGLEDLLKDEKSGLALESFPPTPEELSKKLLYLLERPDLIEKFGNYNKSLALSKYDTRAVCFHIAQIYNKVLQ